MNPGGMIGDLNTMTALAQLSSTSLSVINAVLATEAESKGADLGAWMPLVDSIQDDGCWDWPTVEGCVLRWPKSNGIRMLAARCKLASTTRAIA
jgi:hypothetical protein